MKILIKILFLIFFIIFLLFFIKIIFLNHKYKIVKYNEKQLEKDVIITFHGIYGTEKQLKGINENLSKEGYKIISIQYPTLDDDISTMSKKYIEPIIDTEFKNLNKININRKKYGKQELKLHIVAHSMGTCLIRYYLRENKGLRNHLGKVILISPPSHGSDLSDSIFSKILKPFIGKAVSDMRTDKNSFVNRLGNPDYECIVLIGNKSNNLLYSLLIKGNDDGMVPISTAKLENADFKIINGTTHTSILKNEETIKSIFNFINSKNY